MTAPYGLADKVHMQPSQHVFVGAEAGCGVCGSLRVNAVHCADEACAMSHYPSVVSLTGDSDFDEILAKCFDILKCKGIDYTIGSPDRLANFRKVAEFTGMTPEQVLGTYFYKHVAAIFAYIKGQTESEPIEGRICDVVNYMLLFGKMVAEKKRAASKQEFKITGTTGTGCNQCGKLATVNSEVICIDCFSNVDPISRCIECKAPGVVNASGHCYKCSATGKAP